LNVAVVVVCYVHSRRALGRVSACRRARPVCLLLGGSGWRGIVSEIRLGKVRGCLSVQVLDEAAKMYKSLASSCSPSSQDNRFYRGSCWQY